MNPVIVLWDIFGASHVRELAYLAGHENEISDIQFLSPYPALASCDCGGNIFLWSTYPAPKPHRRFYNFVNPSFTVSDSSCSATHLSWHKDTAMLLLADTEGRLKLWDIAQAMESRGVKKVDRARFGSQQLSTEDFRNQDAR